jgi:acid phosphatase (class A)
VIHNAHTCYPSDEQNVQNDGSYPSARGAVGWAYAQVLSELNPARASEILQRARDFGQSRVVCDEEWLSDISAGQVIADATLGLIRNKPMFRKDFAAAQRETAAALKSGIKPANCQSEMLALANR